jgi:hypothetical protein
MRVHCHLHKRSARPQHYQRQVLALRQSDQAVGSPGPLIFRLVSKPEQFDPHRAGLQHHESDQTLPFLLVRTRPMLPASAGSNAAHFKVAWSLLGTAKKPVLEVPFGTIRSNRLTADQKP